jgi:hypothetical protein
MFAERTLAGAVALAALVMLMPAAKADDYDMTFVAVGNKGAPAYVGLPPMRWENDILDTWFKRSIDAPSDDYQIDCSLGRYRTEDVYVGYWFKPPDNSPQAGAIKLACDSPTVLDLRTGKIQPRETGLGDLLHLLGWR